MIGLNCVKISIFSSFHDRRWVSEMLLTSYYPCNIQTKIKFLFYYLLKYREISEIFARFAILTKFLSIEFLQT